MAPQSSYTYRLYLHELYEEQAGAVLEDFPKLEKQLNTAYKLICAQRSEGGGGKLMRNLAPDVADILCREWVGGNDGHRLIFARLEENKIVFPIFLSPVPKREYEYDEGFLCELCREIVTEFTEEDYDKFVRLNLDRL